MEDDFGTVFALHQGELARKWRSLTLLISFANFIIYLQNMPTYMHATSNEREMSVKKL